MTNSVTFPVALGGDGKTYTDDADPDTGLDGLGYTTRFIPCLKQAVAMAGYTAKYAAKIDAAAAAADRAEDAKQYVEAVAEAYKVNLLDQFKRQATLGLDFVEGRYWIDDGERIDTNNPGEILTIERSTQKLEEGPNGFLRASEINSLARTWRDGNCVGFSSEGIVSNLAHPSNDFSVNWLVNSGGAFRYVSDQRAPDGGLGCYEFYSLGNGSSAYFSRTRTLDTSKRYCHSIWFKPLTQQGIFRLGLHSNLYGGNATYNAFSVSDQSLTSSAPEGTYGCEKRSNGWYRMWATAQTSDEISSGLFAFIVWPLGLGDDAGFLVWGAQIEEGSYPTSNITTVDTPVSRGRDVVTAGIGDWFNKERGSLFFECSVRRVASAGFALSLAGANSNNYIGIGYLTSRGLGGNCYWRNDGEGFVSSSLASLSPGDTFKSLLSWEGVRVLFVVNGRVLYDGESSKAMPNVSQLRFNSRLNPTDFPLQGVNSALFFRPSPSSISEAISLTQGS